MWMRGPSWSRPTQRRGRKPVTPRHSHHGIAFCTMDKPKASRLVRYPIYTIGDLSSGIYSVTPSILLMFYMTNILGISVGLATLAVVLPKIVDLISSPVVGGMSDRTSTSVGRRRPYILFAGLTILPTFGFIWGAPFGSPFASACFVIAIFSVCTFCYSCFLVPYCALNSEIATGYHDSTALNSYRAVYSMLGCVLAGAGAPLIVEKFGGGRPGYLAMGIVMGSVMAASVTTTFFASREPRRHVDGQRLTKAEIWRALVNNRPFLLLLFSYVLHVVGGGVVGATLAYFVTYVLHRDTDFLSLLFFLTFGASVAAIPLFVHLGKLVGKFGSFAVALVVAGTAALGYLMVHRATPVPFVLAIATVLGMSEGGIQVFAYSMLADCIKHGDKRGDAPQAEAVLSGVFVAGEKLGFALGALVAGGLFALAGLTETQEGFVEQPNSAIWSIRLAVSVIPMVVNVLAVILFWFYRPFDLRIVAPAPTELHSEQPSVS